MKISMKALWGKVISINNYLFIFYLTCISGYFHVPGAR